MQQDTDSDVAEPRDGGKMKVRWTQEEVVILTCLIMTGNPDLLSITRFIFIG